jgi:argininosuccinate lyase
MKLWGGRFKKPTDPIFEAFGRSLESDQRLVFHDLRACRAHIQMLSQRGVLEMEEAEPLIAAIEELLASLQSGEPVEGNDEDIHSWVERMLKEKVGDASSCIRIGRSRNDLVVTDFRLYVMEACQEVKSLLRDLQKTLFQRASEDLESSLPGYTHLQRAQPVLLAHHLMAHFWSLERDFKRFELCREEADCCILGAGALAGSSWPIDPEITARSLGFSRILDNSLDGVSDRDFALQFLFCCATCATHLSRMAQELVMWSSSEFSFCRFDDAWSTGSSLMPQKKNPDPAELIRGKTGLFLGNLVELLTTVKALPLAYNRDLQQDKPPVFRSKEELTSCLQVMNGTMATLQFRSDVMRAAAEDKALLITDLADVLVRNGLPFSQAHHLAGRTVSDPENLSAQEQTRVDQAWEQLTLESALASRSHPGAAGRTSVERQLKKAEGLLG